MSRDVRWVIAASILLYACSLATVQGIPRASQSPSARGVEPIDWTPLLPPGAGREHVTALCSHCHTPGVLVLQRRTAKMWRDFLLGMNSARATGGELCACIGGPLDETEIALLTEYLSAAFNRDNPIDQLPLNVNTASPRALARLPGLSEADIRKLVEHRARAAFVSKEEIRRVLGASTFQPIAEFIDVKDSMFRADGLLPM
jgi:hypothetical protein